jgi:two-component system capsular synthesis sensor histidine kinase RcsC
VVDDDPLNRLLLTTMLTALDCQVDEAASGAEALAALEEHEFDRMLLDIHMPGMTGIELAAKLRSGPSANREIPIVAVSGDLSRTLKQYRQAGFDGVIEKPISFGSVRVSLETLRHSTDRDARP